MGDVADMMLDGTLCEGCGVFLDDLGGVGFPRLCGGCARDRLKDGRMVVNHGLGFQDVGEAPKPVKGKASVPKVKCPTCGRKVKHNGLADHQRDAHALNEETKP